MPRANINQHHPAQQDTVSQLLKLPPAKQAWSAIRIAAQDRPDGRIAANDLAKILKVTASLIKSKIPYTRFKRDYNTAVVSLTSARKAIRQFLPLTLEWKSAVTVARQNKLHRNQVERIIREFGNPKMALYASDQKLYISPEGERLVAKKKVELDSFGDRPFLKEIARKYDLNLNAVTAYFSNRQERIERDPLGRARLTLAQAQDFDAWRKDVAIRKLNSDIEIDGQQYRSIVRAAREKARLLAPPGTPAFEALKAREHAALRFFARNSSADRHTKVGTYVPVPYADNFMLSISTFLASRMANVSQTTIKTWRYKDPQLAAPKVAGRRTIGISLPALLKKIEDKYINHPKLSKQGFIPCLRASLICQRIADELGTDLESIAFLVSSRPADISQTYSASKKQQLVLERANGLSRSLPVREPEYKSSSPTPEKIDRRLGKEPRSICNALISKMGLVPVDWYIDFINSMPDRLLEFSTTQPDKPDPALCLELSQFFGLTKPAISASAAVAYIELVSSNRSTEPERVYRLARQILKINEPWPKTYKELNCRVSTGQEAPNYPLGFGALMALLKHPESKLYAVGQSRFTPKKGDILINQELKDFGLITKVVSNNGRLSARATLIHGRRCAEFSIE